jgi:hypothetical protein
MEALSMGALIRLNLRQFTKIAASKGWTKPDGSIAVTRAAAAIGCEPSTVSRILRGERACGGEFVANLLIAAKPWEFNDLFYIETDDEPEDLAS